MLSEDQQALRLRLLSFMRRFLLIVQLIGLSALLLGSLIGSIILMIIISYVLLMVLASLGNWSFGPFALLIFLGFLALILLYWHFIVLKVFKHVRKSLRQKPTSIQRKSGGL